MHILANAAVAAPGPSNDRPRRLRELGGGLSPGRVSPVSWRSRGFVTRPRGARPLSSLCSPSAAIYGIVAKNSAMRRPPLASANAAFSSWRNAAQRRPDDAPHPWCESLKPPQFCTTLAVFPKSSETLVRSCPHAMLARWTSRRLSAV